MSEVELFKSILKSIEALELRVASLEALLTPKAAAPPYEDVYKSVTDAYEGWVPRPAGLDKQIVSDRARFVPDYGSEGEY